jgi:hypothetical protein
VASTGITQRHGTNCKGGRKCGCPWLATVDLPDRKKRRKTHKTERDARDWQTLTRADVKRGKVRHTPAGQPTVAQAAEEFLDGPREGTIPNASGRAFKPATLRGYERGLRLRVLPAIGAKKLGPSRAATCRASSTGCRAAARRPPRSPTRSTHCAPSTGSRSRTTS